MEGRGLLAKLLERSWEASCPEWGQTGLGLDSFWPWKPVNLLCSLLYLTLLCTYDTPGALHTKHFA